VPNHSGSELEAVKNWHKTVMGSCPAWVEVLGRTHPKAVVGYTELRKAVYEEGALSRKVKQLILLGINLVRNYEKGIELHMRLALEEGASESEVAETILTATLSAAAPAHHEGGIILAEKIKHKRDRTHPF
jgi:alkylhydroperoxidase/carboxymuconolactone decarboxylase family protein YurZ